MKNLFCIALSSMLFFISCEPVEHSKIVAPDSDKVYIGLEDVAKVLSELPLENEHLNEVMDAVSSSSVNGYDDEYTMRELFTTPGLGVGDNPTKAATKSYSKPLRDLFADYYKSVGTKSSESLSERRFSAEEYMDVLTNSDIQIYWPYFESWDKSEYPIITFDPGDGSVSNIGYKILVDEKGNRAVEEVLVTEETAKDQPVWVINRNDDREYSSIEMLRKNNPEWGETGGGIVVGGKNRQTFSVTGEIPERTMASGSFKTLILKDFTMHRNYDPWFAGASEFFVKCGSIEDFTASTEAELKLYSPAITDFMVVVKRGQVGKPRPFNAVLVSQWTDQLESCAFMITEDDGGTITNWNCEANVKIKSKSYGFDIKIPFNSKDDIVWRGQLSAKYFERYSNVKGNFGDVSITFSIVSK